MSWVAEHAMFVRTFLRNPRRTGSIVPSSRWLADAMVRGNGLEHARTIVEVGAGTGSFTSLILKTARPGSFFMAVELSPDLARALTEKFPQVRVVQGSVEHLDAHLARAGVASAEYVVSSLPWASFPEPLARSLLAAIVKAMAPGGGFVTFAYVNAGWMPGARRFAAMLRASFARVERSPVIWRNFPPAFVYRCTK